MRAILFVDDETMVLEMFAHFATEKNIPYRTARNATEALEILKSSPGGFGLVITDINMPGMNGGELAAAARQLAPNTPVIAYTGLPVDEEAAFDAVVFKPSPMKDLLCFFAPEAGRDVA